MLTVDNPVADAVRQVHAEKGERAGVAEFQRHFPRINASIALECVQRIVGLRLPFKPVHGGIGARTRAQIARIPDPH